MVQISKHKKRTLKNAKITRMSVFKINTPIWSYIKDTKDPNEQKDLKDINLVKYSNDLQNLNEVNHLKHTNDLNDPKD